MCLAVSNRFYWKSIFQDVHDFVNTCEICMRSKPNFAQKPVPLHPVEPAYYPGQVWSIDHKPLCRKTEAGNTALLVTLLTGSQLRSSSTATPRMATPPQSHHAALVAPVVDSSPRTAWYMPEDYDTWE